MTWPTSVDRVMVIRIGAVSGRRYMLLSAGYQLRLNTPCQDLKQQQLHGAKRPSAVPGVVERQCVRVCVRVMSGL